jgi:hypothetical protein
VGEVERKAAKVVFPSRKSGAKRPFSTPLPFLRNGKEKECLSNESAPGIMLVGIGPIQKNAWRVFCAIETLAA